MRPPDLNFYVGVSGRSQESRFWRLDPPPCAVTVGVNRYSHFFFAGVKLTQTSPQSPPRATLMHIPVIVRLTYTILPAPDRGGARR